MRGYATSFCSFYESLQLWVGSFSVAFGSHRFRHVGLCRFRCTVCRPRAVWLRMQWSATHNRPPAFHGCPPPRKRSLRMLIARASIAVLVATDDQQRASIRRDQTRDSIGAIGGNTLTERTLKQCRARVSQFSSSEELLEHVFPHGFRPLAMRVVGSRRRVRSFRPVECIAASANVLTILDVEHSCSAL